jgi:IS30 family transposase
MSKCKRITFEEREKIEMLLKKGFGMYSTATAIQRPNSTVTYEIRNNGGRHGYDAVKAQQRADTASERGSETLKLRGGNRKSIKESFEQRINNLEMQLEIILQTIKEIKR